MSERSESLIKALTELGAAMNEQAAAMDRQNELLVQIVAQNADLIAAVVDDDEEEDEPKYDLSGRPLTP